MNSGFSWLPRFALHHRITVLMGLVGLLVLSVITYLRLPVELMPSGREHATIRVEAEYRDASPADMLEQVLDPVEEALRSLSGLKDMVTGAGFERGSILLRFERGTDMDAAYLSLKEKLDRVRAKLPEDFQRFLIRRWGHGTWPILWSRVVLTSGDPAELPELLRELEQVLLRIPGVARVDTYGWADREVAILANPAAMEAQRLDPGRLASAVRRDNFALPLGVLESREGDLPVRALARLTSLDELAALPLAPSSSTPRNQPRGDAAERDKDGGAGQGAGAVADADSPAPQKRLVRLRDVARVGLREQPVRYYTQVDGRPAILLGIQKRDAANTVQVGGAIQRTLREELPRQPRLRRLEVRPLFSEAEVINDSLASLEWTALWGGLFALAVLWMFLRGWRPTLLVVSAIPLSLLATLVAMFFLGLTLNLITITALMLALGMLVDNAVVVIENTSRLRAAGVPAERAVVQGPGEVGLAILTGTLTTIIVFLPLPFLDTRAFLSFLFRHLSWPISLSLTASLVVALLVMPLAARHLLAGQELRPPPWFDGVRRAYGRALRRMLARPLDGVTVLLLVLLTVWVPAAGLRWDQFSSRSQRRIRVAFTHDPVYGLDGVESYFNGLQARLLPEKQRLGIDYALVRYNRDGGRLSLFLHPKEERELRGRALTEALRKVIGNHPGVRYTLSAFAGGGATPSLSLVIAGPRPQTLEHLAREMSRALKPVRGLGAFQFEDARTPDHLVVSLRRESAERLGVTAREVANRVSAALRGAGRLPPLLMDGVEREVVLQQDQRHHSGVVMLENLRLWSRSGAVLPLAAVSEFHLREAPTRIERRNGEVSLSITAPIEEGTLQAVEQAVRARLAVFEMPTGYRWFLGDEVRGLREDRASLGMALVLALLAVFLVMGVLFESWLLPLAVLATVPLALFGSLWLLYLTGTALDTTGMIGLVILAGVVVNNGIVLVDRINRNRLAGLELRPAISKAGEERLRPILMTALTTVFGLLPMALGYTNVAGYSFSALGRVVAGGLLASTVLTLFAVPLVYLGLARLGGRIAAR